MKLLQECDTTFFVTQCSCRNLSSDSLVNGHDSIMWLVVCG